MNKWLKNLQKIEFVVTNACTGRCKHCSQGDHGPGSSSTGPRAEQAEQAARAAQVVTRVTAHYPISTVMTFGGEPLLCPEVVCAIHAAATAAGVPRRQVITNGYFSNDQSRMKAMARELAAAGVNDLLLSVDAFHQETIPLSVVMAFAEEALAAGIPLRLQPAWLVSPADDNPYNQKTRALLAAFAPLSDKAGIPIPVGAGNVVFPDGNALRYLGEYFKDGAPPNPYVEDPRDVRCLSVEPDGSALNGNVFESDVLDVLRGYVPPADPTATGGAP